VKQVTRYETSDGELFVNELGAIAHEEQLTISRRVGAYVSAQGLIPPASTRVTNDLTSFLNWELEQIHAETKKVVESLDKEAA
jgi:hypothetical protein